MLSELFQLALGNLGRARANCEDISRVESVHTWRRAVRGRTDVLAQLR